jgi:hypothetical protein
MKAIAIIAGALVGLGMAHAQPLPKLTVIGSASGQFFVSARAFYPSPHSIDLASGPNMVSLEPALLAVSCERVKQELLRELSLPDQWQGKIFVALRPARTAADPISVVPERLGGNWDCGVELPDALNRDRFVEAVVRACLLEIANRSAADRSAEIPEWLAQGLTRQLLGSSAIKLLLPAPRTKENGLSVTREVVDFSDAPRKSGSLTLNRNPLSEALETLQTNRPLTFDELSWPTETQLSADGAAVYSSSAQLFVHELLRLKNGAASLRAMLAEMPDYLNWQLAFLDAFHGAFQEPLDVEKWWALQVAEFSGRDVLHLLTPEESGRQLDALFELPIEVQLGPAPPMRANTTFQTVIRGWSRAQQLPLLKKKLWELDLLRLRVAPDFMPLLDDYRQTLQDYYRRRTDVLRESPLPDKMIQEVTSRLDALDSQRAKMRATASAPVTAAAAP